FTELMAAREELKTLKVRAAENESALALEKNKSRKLEQDFQLLSSKARKDDSGPKIGKLLEQKDEIIANLNGKMNALESSEQAAEAEYAAGLKAAEEARQDLANLLKHKEDESLRVEGRVRSLEKEAAFAEEKWRLADAQLNNAAAHVGELENELEILRGRLASVESEKEHHKHAALEAQKAITKLSEAAGQKEGEEEGHLYAALQAETERSARLSARCDEATARLDALAAEKNRLAAENSVLKKRGQASAGASQQELEDLGRKLKNKESELESVRDELGSLKNEYDGLLEDRKALQEKYAAELRTENAMREEARRNISERDKLISELTKSGGDTLRETERLKAEKESLAAAMSSLKAGEDKELRAALKESEKLLKAKEQDLSKITFDLEKVKNDKASLIEHERRLNEDLHSRPYRALLKEAEDRLLQKEKMLGEMHARLDNVMRDSAALKRGGSQPDGDLAELLAGVSHQVSNSVGIIRSNAEFCLEAPATADLKESLGAIVRNIVTLQEKIENMLGFSRPVTLQYVDTALRKAAEEALAAAGKVRDLSRIRVSFSEDPGLKTLKADRVRLASALEQVFLNAADAMPGGGELRIALKQDREGGQAIEISDTGGGIEPKNLSTVFHPFFTTRPGKMGLGLALAKNIIKAHGGSIKISSSPGKGTVVSITLPAKPRS
ncbi:MAG: ATP-binding protein, partial [Elusimicrobiota bacterium]